MQKIQKEQALKDVAIEENIEKHTELNPKLFGEDNKLKPEVLEKIKLIVNEFLNDLNEDGIKLVLKDYILVGSNVSYNYTDDSDLDIHLLADVSDLNCPDNLYPLLYSAYRSLFNKKFDKLNFYGIPVEIYVETNSTPLVSNGIYSAMRNEWIKEPEVKEIPELDKAAFDSKFAKWEARYKKILEKDEKILNECLLLEYKPGEMFSTYRKQEEATAKMRAFNSGIRKENLKAASTDKLLDYFKICETEKLFYALRLIDNELKSRHIFVPVKTIDGAAVLGRSKEADSTTDSSKDRVRLPLFNEISMNERVTPDFIRIILLNKDFIESAVSDPAKISDIPDLFKWDSQDNRAVNMMLVLLTAIILNWPKTPKYLPTWFSAIGIPNAFKKILAALIADKTFISRLTKAINENKGDVR